MYSVNRATWFVEECQSIPNPIYKPPILETSMAVRFIHIFFTIIVNWFVYVSQHRGEPCFSEAVASKICIAKV